MTAIKPGSQNDRIIRALADGKWHTSRDLHERCGYMRTNSRVSELRSHGYLILGESVPGRTGTDGYRYRLLASPGERLPMLRTVVGDAAAPASEAGEAGAQLTLLGAP